MATPTTQPTGASVDDFIAAAVPERRRDEGFVLKQMFDEVTGAVAEMWGPSMVGYGEFAYEYASGHHGNCFVLGFAPRKASMSIYGLIIPANDDLIERLGNVKIGKGCIWAIRLDRLDLQVLRAMTERAWAQQTWEHPLGHHFVRIR